MWSNGSKNGMRKMEALVHQGERNDKPVLCDWCDEKCKSYEARKIMMHEYDAFDYNWTCPKCWDKAHE
jgi:hypothetical protein